MNESGTITQVPVAPPFRGLARPIVASALFFMIVTGIAYPLATTGVAQALFGTQAQGSLVTKDGQVVGSRLIGQNFTQAQYFHGRPSMTGDAPYNAASSGASNQGVLSRKLGDAVGERTRAYRAENGLAPDARVPVDAVTASASGLDPHISLANARLQAARVAKARGLTEAQVLAFVAQHTSGRQFGVLGERRVHVLDLNLALDAAAAALPAAR